MKHSPSQFTFTIAKRADFPIVARLCRRAVSPRDYVLSILRQTIDEKGLFLAWRGKELVGMTNFEKCIDGSGWLSMARTDPNWRRTGVAIFLQKQVATYAKRRGITTLRLWTSSQNKPSIRAIRKGGFKEVCEAAHISYNLRTKGKRAPIGLPSAGSRIQLKSLLRSEYLSQMNGYFAYGWHFVKADTRLLRRIQRKKELLNVGQTVFVQTRPERIFGRLATSVALLDGPFTESLRYARLSARATGAQFLGVYIPYNEYFLRAARRLGFRREHWGRHCLVFERKLS